MRCKIVTCLFEDERYVRYALLREFDGKVLEWKELDILIPEEERDDIPKTTEDSLTTDGTAFFDSRNNAMQVKAVLEGI